ncbi:hypothetical protein BD408DRAFT_410008 [Parasitella parasitica]|nr:hypothetical protein BD408DRAFT_410008 [Parasitella parasitica]
MMHQVITGQVRCRRKLHKTLFVIDMQPENDTSPKSRILFRTDDGSLNINDFQKSFVACRPGSVVSIKVNIPNDPNKEQSTPHEVWQCYQPVEVVAPYSNRKAFIPDRLMGKASVSIERPDQELLPIVANEKHLPLCKYWINKNTCERRSECPFQHPTGDAFEVAQREWLKQRERDRKLATFNPEDPHTSKKPHGLRAIIFAYWIKQTFTEQLKDGGGVLDVAGGKGEISMVLSRGFGIPTTVVEPKTRKLTNFWFTRLRRLMLRFEAGKELDWGDKNVQLAFQTWPFNIKPNYLHTMLNDEFLIQNAQLLENTSLFVGLHSDQATIPIVDAALKAGKAFAVVPCCVFSNENRSRRLRNGALVTTTEQQIQYICEKDTFGHGGQIQTAYLDFEGKNRVVYWIPSTA